MKKWYALFILLTPFLISLAQPCIPNGTPTATGLSPLPDSFPCITQNQAFSQTVFFKNANFFNTFGGFQVDTLELLNVLNLPDSMHYGTNKTPAKYLAAENGCIQIFGNTPDTIGQYKLRIYIKMTMHQSATPANKFAVQGEADSLTAALGQGSIFRYYLRVIKNCGMDCPSVQDTSTKLFIPYGPAVPQIIASGDTVFCSGKNVVLRVDSNLGTFLWSNGATTPEVTISQTGNYTVTAYANCDSAVSRPQRVQVNPGIVATDTILRFANYVSYIAYPAGAQYRWILRAATDSVLAGEVSDTLYRSCSNLGYYAVVVSALGCSDTSAFKNFGCIPENGIQDMLPADAVAVFPNPAHHLLGISVQKDVDVDALYLYDVLGREWLAVSKPNAGIKSESVDLSAFPNGMYVLVAKGSNGAAAIKVIKN